MYRQAQAKPFPEYPHWRNQERLEELEMLLDSEYRLYIDPRVVTTMKRIIQNRKQ